MTLCSDEDTPWGSVSGSSDDSPWGPVGGSSDDSPWGPVGGSSDDSPWRQAGRDPSNFSYGDSPWGPAGDSAGGVPLEDLPWLSIDGPSASEQMPVTEQSGNHLPPVFPRGVDILVFYQALNGVQQNVYDEVLGYLSQRKCEFEIVSNCQNDDIFKALNAVYYDHPEFFWLTSSSVLKTVTSGQDVTRIVTVATEYPMKSVLSLQCRIDTIVNKFISRIPRGASVYDKVRLAYDFVISNTSYELNAPHNQSAAGVFLDRRAVCAGYSRAFCYLLRLMGVPCGCVKGSAKKRDDAGLHMWNIVCINNVFTYVDTTWGELEINRGTGRKKAEGITYKYLCVTTEEILRTRTIDGNQLLPQCSSQQYDWFARSGRMLDDFSPSRMDSILATAFSRSERNVMVKFKIQGAFDQCMRWLSTSDIYAGSFGKHIKAASTYRSTSITWSHDDDLRIISISW